MADIIRSSINSSTSYNYPFHSPSHNNFVSNSQARNVGNIRARASLGLYGSSLGTSFSESCCGDSGPVSSRLNFNYAKPGSRACWSVGVDRTESNRYVDSQPQNYDVNSIMKKYSWSTRSSLRDAFMGCQGVTNGHGFSTTKHNYNYSPVDFLPYSVTSRQATPSSTTEQEDDCSQHANVDNSQNQISESTKKVRSHSMECHSGDHCQSAKFDQHVRSCSTELDPRRRFEDDDNTLISDVVKRIRSKSLEPRTNFTRRNRSSSEKKQSIEAGDTKKKHMKKFKKGSIGKQSDINNCSCWCGSSKDKEICPVHFPDSKRPPPTESGGSDGSSSGNQCIHLYRDDGGSVKSKSSKPGSIVERKGKKMKKRTPKRPSMAEARQAYIENEKLKYERLELRNSLYCFRRKTTNECTQLVNFVLDCCEARRNNHQRLNCVKQICDVPHLVVKEGLPRASKSQIVLPTTRLDFPTPQKETKLPSSRSEIYNAFQTSQPN